MISSASIAAVSRLYPFLSGNFSLINHSRFSPLFPQTDSLVWCPSPGGPLLVPLNDVVGRCIYFTGDYDRKITWLCRKLLRRGDTALDIGANLGVVTLAMAKFVGPEGRVHSFEPNPAMQKLLSQSISRSHQHVTLHKIALGSSDGERRLYVPANNIGAGSLIRGQGSFESVTCRVRRLGDILKEDAINRVRLVKLDVEGFEHEVLKGAGDLLSSIRPAIILETNEDFNGPFKEYPAIAALIDHDYRFLSIPKALFSMRVFDVDLDRVGTPSHDVLAVPVEQYAELKVCLS